MAHHSGLVDPAGSPLEAIFPAKPGELGATGDFPEGKLTPTDEGEIKLRVGSAKGKVIVDFGTKVLWVGMTAAEAREFGELMIRKAAEAEA